MKPAAWFLVGGLMLGSGVKAEVAPVAVQVPDAKAWVGQRVPIYIELRAPGSFAGTATFDLPELPGTLLMKVGNPVVGSRELDGQSWFVQTHELALFSQAAGRLHVPAFSVRFASREGFTGPARDAVAQVPDWTVDIQRPPGSEGLGFLITTESLDVTETWNPPPAPANAGAMFKRTIVQRVPQVSGMALAPAPATAPEGVRVYRGDAQVDDQLERGDFQGERRETISYLFTQPGEIVLPAITYVWWNPKTEKLVSKVLPDVRFEIAAAPSPTGRARRVWLLLFAVALAAGMGAWQRRSVADRVRRWWRTLNPPDRAAARNLRRACRRHDAQAAEGAWMAWQATQGTGFKPGPELHDAVLALQHHLFGPVSAGRWQGDELARRFGEHLATARRRSSRLPPSALPLLNP